MQLGHPLEPLADQREIEGRRRLRRGELDDEHAGRGVADRAAPDGGSVGDQPDLAQQVGGGASSGHVRSCPREPGVLGRTARTGSRRRACGLSAYRLTVMPTEPTPRRPSTGASAARPIAGPDARRSSVTPVRLGAATVLVIAVLVAGFGLLGGSVETGRPSVAAAATSALTGSPSATLAVTAAGSASPDASATEAPATERATPDSTTEPTADTDRRSNTDADRNPTGHGHPGTPRQRRFDRRRRPQGPPAPPRRLACEALRARRLGRDAVGRRPHLARHLGRRRHRVRSSSDARDRFRPRVDLEDLHGGGRPGSRRRGQAASWTSGSRRCCPSSASIGG